MLRNFQALTYRVGHHSTSDDSTKYRGTGEIEYWKTARNPVNRFKRWVERNDWWSDKDELELRSSVRKQVNFILHIAFNPPLYTHDTPTCSVVLTFCFRIYVSFLQLMHAIQVAEKAQKPPLEDLFSDVYDQLPSNLQEQERLLRKTIQKHPKDYPSDVPL